MLAEDESYAVLPSCILSIIGCLSVLIIFVKYKNLRHDQEFQLACILSFLYLILNIDSLHSADAYSTGSDKGLCTAQAVVLIIFGLSGILWTGYIGLYLYLKAEQANQENNYHPSI